MSRLYPPALLAVVGLSALSPTIISRIGIAQEQAKVSPSADWLRGKWIFDEAFTAEKHRKSGVTEGLSGFVVAGLNAGLRGVQVWITDEEVIATTKEGNGEAKRYKILAVPDAETVMLKEEGGKVTTYHREGDRFWTASTGNVRVPFYFRRWRPDDDARSEEAGRPANRDVPRSPPPDRPAENVNGVRVLMGDPQVTLTWDSGADLDLHVVEPGGSELDWEHRNDTQGGAMDIDDVDGFGPENIHWGTDGRGIGPAGQYRWFVRYYGGPAGASIPTRWKVRVKQDGKETVTEGQLNQIGQSSKIASFEVKPGARLRSPETEGAIRPGP